MQKHVYLTRLVRKLKAERGNAKFFVKKNRAKSPAGIKTKKTRQNDLVSFSTGREREIAGVNAKFFVKKNRAKSPTISLGKTLY